MQRGHSSDEKGGSGHDAKRVGLFLDVVLELLFARFVSATDVVWRAGLTRTFMPNRPATSVPIPIPIVHIEIWQILNNDACEKPVGAHLEIKGE